MEPRQRVLLALAHEQPDKTPWHFEFTSQALAVLVDHCGDPRLSDVKFFDQWVGNHCRFVGPQSKGLFHGLEEEVGPGLWRDGWGVVWDTRGLYGEGSWGRPVNCVLPEPRLDNFTLPEPPSADAFAHYARFLEENRQYFTIGDEGHLFETAWALRGIESFLMDLVLHPGFVDELLAAITDYYLGVIRESFKYEIDAFAFGEDLGSQTMGLIMGPSHWRRYFKPCMARMFAPIKQAGKTVWMHSDGQIDDILEDLVEIGLDVYNPFQPEIRNLFQTKQRYRNRLAFHGGIGIQELLPYGTPEQVKAEVARLIAGIGAGGGYIVGTAHAVMADVPAENIMALIEAVQDQ
jgi:uroporphyrinogen decarboxylase